MAFSNTQIEDLKERADIATLVGRRVQLRKAGKDYVGLCPFHGEKSPSFYVVPNKHLWHCFGCGETGDVFKFFMKLDGMPFVDALQMVAREAGIILADEKVDPEEARRRAHQDQLAELMERAVKFYEQKLWHPSGKAAREHLVKRGVQEEWARRFGLGYGGAGMDDLSKALEKAGASVPQGIEAGLLIESSRGGRPFDRFHGRLIVPIRIPRPPNGRAVALGGRFLEGITPSRPDKKPAKYINSPETPLYSKGHVLFGLDLARDSIRKTDRAIIVEGYFDVLGMHQAGVPLAVATCGTSLTANHLDLLVRTGAREVVFLFDGDAAGTRAATRAAELCAKAQVPAKVATLPEGLDPDEFARQRGQEGMEALLERGKPAIEYLIEKAMDGLGPQATVEERVRAVQAVKPVVLAAPEGLSRELYVAQIAERLKVSVPAVQSVLQERDPHEPHHGNRARPRPEPSSEPEAFEPPPPPVQNPAYPEPRRSERRDDGTQALVQAQRVAAQRTYTSEEGIAIALLKYPGALAPVVAQEGVLGDFGNPQLRALGEAVVQAQAEGLEVVPADLFAGIGDEKLRETLQKKFAQDDATLDQTASHLIRVLDKLRQEIRKKRAREALAKQKTGELGDDDVARKAFEEEQQRLLEESRAVHRRMRERDRRK